jgi:hypothetical protein
VSEGFVGVEGRSHVSATSIDALYAYACACSTTCNGGTCTSTEYAASSSFGTSNDWSSAFYVHASSTSSVYVIYAINLHADASDRIGFTCLDASFFLQSSIYSTINVILYICR